VQTGLAINRLVGTREHVWIADVVAGAIVHVDPRVPIEGNLDQFEARGGSLWVLERSDGTVTRRDVSSGEEIDSAGLGETPT
jgi:hypothetical protein